MWDNSVAGDLEAGRPKAQVTETRYIDSITFHYRSFCVTSTNGPLRLARLHGAASREFILDARNVQSIPAVPHVRFMRIVCLQTY